MTTSRWKGGAAREGCVKRDRGGQRGERERGGGDVERDRGGE